jgi:hypothetical protein
MEHLFNFVNWVSFVQKYQNSKVEEGALSLNDFDNQYFYHHHHHHHNHHHHHHQYHHHYHHYYY